MKLTNQETKIIQYLSNKENAYWEELAQFAKDPQSVKLKTIQKSVSDIKKKFKDANIPPPFNCKFSILPDLSNQDAPKEQTLVQVKRTPNGNLIPKASNELPIHRDFKLEKPYRRVRTKNGVAELRESEWQIFCLLYENAEKPVSLEDMKNAIWKNWGSKTPPSWAESISRNLTSIRKSIPELKFQNRLLTITGQSTSYMLK